MINMIKIVDKIIKESEEAYKQAKKISKELNNLVSRISILTDEMRKYNGKI